MYDEGEDATKAAYVAKMDDIRFVAGPIIQRYKDKVEADRQAVLKAQEEANAKKREEAEAKKKAEEETKKAAEPKKGDDVDMKDVDGEQPSTKPDAVDEMD